MKKVSERPRKRSIVVDDEPEELSEPEVEEVITWKADHNECKVGHFAVIHAEYPNDLGREFGLSVLRVWTTLLFLN